MGLLATFSGVWFSGMELPVLIVKLNYQGDL